MMLMTIKTVCEKGLLLFSNRFPEHTPLSIIGRKIDSLPPNSCNWLSNSAVPGCSNSDRAKERKEENQPANN